jgi:hypothetical protein
MIIKNLRALRLIGLLSLSVAVAACSSSKKKTAPATKSASATAATAPRPAGGPPAKKDGMKPYKEVITGKAKSDKGLFTVHKVEDKYFYENTRNNQRGYQPPRFPKRCWSGRRWYCWR